MSRFFVTQNLPKRKGKMSGLICCGNILTQHNFMPLLISCLAYDRLLATPPLLPSRTELEAAFPNQNFCGTAYSDRNWLVFTHAICNMSAKESEKQFVITSLMKHGHFQVASSIFHGDLMVIKHINNCWIQYILRQLSTVTKSHPF